MHDAINSGLVNLLLSVCRLQGTMQCPYSQGSPSPEILTVTELVAYLGGRLQERNVGCRIPMAFFLFFILSQSRVIAKVLARPQLVLKTDRAAVTRPIGCWLKPVSCLISIA